MTAPPAEPDLRQQVVRGVLWTVVERWAVRLTTLVTFLVLARLLEPEAFGLVALSATFVAIFGTLAEAGISAYLVQADDLSERVLSSVFWTSTALGVTSSGVLVVAAPSIGRVLDVPGVVPVLILLSLNLIGVALIGVPAALLQRELEFGVLAARQTIAATTSAGVGVVAAVCGAGVWALVAQSLTNTAVAIIVLWVKCPWRPTFVWARAESADALRFGGKVFGFNILTVARDQGENLMVGAVLGPAALGYWTVATRILQIVVELGVSVVQTVTGPAFARLKNDPERLRSAYSKATTAVATVMLPLTTTVSLLSTDLIPGLFGSQWEPAGPVAAVLTLASIFGMLIAFDRPIYIALGRPGVEVAITSVVVTLHLAAVVVFADDGLIALAVALVARAALTWPLRLFVLRRVTGMPWSAYEGLVRTLPATVAAALALVSVRQVLPISGPLAWCVLVAAAAVAFAVVAWFMRPDLRRHAPIVIARATAKLRRQFARSSR